MAALPEPAPQLPEPELTDLRLLRSEDLNPLLREEAITWRETLDWDFENSAALVRKFIDMRSLNGFALSQGREVTGYCYYVFEEHKGLVGDLYVRRPFRTAAAEHRLLSAAIDELTSTSYVRRIESQLMMLGHPVSAASRYLSVFPRDYLSSPLPAPAALPPRRLSGRLLVAPWMDHHQEGASQLVAAAYHGHVDGLINDQYRTVAGARRFLYNIVQYPGCGEFLQRASFSTFDREKGVLCGVCLASIVGPMSGHITQVCVARDWQGEGLGYELLRRSLEELERHGFRKVSLTVTSENAPALRLYEKMGFRRTRHFAAHVWEGF
jgi:ribosomal protein S18 acetylase RimI-like enzyme